MFCTNCGKQLQEGSIVCNYCGKSQRSGTGMIEYSPPKMMSFTSEQPRINNIFSALVQEKTPGVIMEFSLWCVICFVVLLSLIAAIMGNGNITWNLLMLFSVGLGVLVAFRLKPIALLYSVVVFNLVTTVVHYVCFAKSSEYLWGNDYYSYSALNIVLFILVVVLSVAIVTCGFIHFFSKINMGNLLTIMVIVDFVLIFILQILMYAVGFLEDGANYLNENLRNYLNYRGYWIGTVSLWVMLVVVTLFYSFFFWGFIDSSKGKIVNTNGIGKVTSVTPGLQGVNGVWAGRIFYLQGRTVTIGSDTQMMIVIPDSYVSGKHCAIRYNPMSGFYEIYDISRNGVLLNTGGCLQKGVYNSVQRGSIIYIGSKKQQFLLL